MAGRRPAKNALFDALARASAHGRVDVYYEALYGELITAGVEARLVDVTDLPWTEVDTLDDLAHARGLLITRVRSQRRIGGEEDALIQPDRRALAKAGGLLVPDSTREVILRPHRVAGLPGSSLLLHRCGAHDEWRDER